MSSERGLQEQLTTLFLDQLQVRVVSPQTDLLETGLLDSLKLVDLLLQLEQQFAIRIAVDDLDVERFRSIETIARFLEEQTASESRPRQATTASSA